MAKDIFHPENTNKVLTIGIFITIGLLLIIIALLICILVHAYSFNSSKSQQQKKREKFLEKAQVEVVYVYSETCGQCQQFDPIFDICTKEFISGIKAMRDDQYDVHIKKVDSKYMDTRYDKYVNETPTVIVFLDNRYMGESIGYKDKEAFLAFLTTSI